MLYTFSGLTSLRNTGSPAAVWDTHPHTYSPDTQIKQFSEISPVTTPEEISCSYFSLKCQDFVKKKRTV